MGFKRLKDDDPTWWDDPEFQQSAKKRKEYRTRKKYDDLAAQIKVQKEAYDRGLFERGKRCPELHPMLWLKVIEFLTCAHYTGAINAIVKMAQTCKMMMYLVYSMEYIWRDLAMRLSAYSNVPNVRRAKDSEGVLEPWRKLSFRLAPLDDHVCRKICMSTVKKQFGLNDEMLRGRVTEVLARNPHGSSAPMRLYPLCAIRKLAGILRPDFEPKTKWDLDKPRPPQPKPSWRSYRRFTYGW